jgi:hypothetical protein
MLRASRLQQPEPGAVAGTLALLGTGSSSCRARHSSDLEQHRLFLTLQLCRLGCFRASPGHACVCECYPQRGVTEHTLFGSSTAGVAARKESDGYQ